MPLRIMQFLSIQFSMSRAHGIEKFVNTLTASYVPELAICTRPETRIRVVSTIEVSAVFGLWATANDCLGLG